MHIFFQDFDEDNPFDKSKNIDIDKVWPRLIETKNQNERANKMRNFAGKIFQELKDSVVEGFFQIFNHIYFNYVENNDNYESIDKNKLIAELTAMIQSGNKELKCFLEAEESVISNNSEKG